MDRLLNMMTVLSIVLILFVLRSVRRAHIRVEYSVSWLGAAVTLLLLSRSGGALGWIGQFLGIGDSSLALGMTMVCGVPGISLAPRHVQAGVSWVLSCSAGGRKKTRYATAQAAVSPRRGRRSPSSTETSSTTVCTPDLNVGGGD